MDIKTGLLYLVMLIPLTSFAERGEFVFAREGQSTVFNSGCVSAVAYSDDNETEPGYLIVGFNGKCENRLDDVVLRNIGRYLDITYRGNKLATVTLLSRMGNYVKIPKKDMSASVLAQIMNDYDVTPAIHHADDDRAFLSTRQRVLKQIRDFFN